MPAAPLAFLPEVFTLHVEELGFLWRQRRTALHAPERTWRSLCDLDRRIEAHIDGTLAIGAEMPPQLRPVLDDAEAEPGRRFAAAIALLRARDAEGARTLLTRIASDQDEALAALTDALAMSAPPRLLEHLLPLATGGDAPRRVGVLRVFAMRGATLPEAHTIDALATHDDAAVRTGAWQLLAHRGTALGDTLLQRGLADEDPSVRAAAVDAAIWTRTPTLLDLARRRLRAPTPNDLPLLGALAMLGTPDDLVHLTHIVSDATLGAARLDIARRVGTPDMVERCIALMAPEVPDVAAAAGQAFWRITGESVAGPMRASLAPPTADAFEAAFAPEVVLPDPIEARRRWTRIGRHLGERDRLVHGVPLDAPVDAETIGRFDVIARGELFQRAHWSGRSSISPFALEAFPQR